MKKIVAALIFLLSFTDSVLAQDKPVRPSAIGVSFFFNDYTTPQLIRSTSLSQVLRDKKWAKFRDMSPGLSVSYFRGLTPHTDFAGSLAFSFPTVPLPDKPNNTTTDALLMEADASLNLKMFTEDYWFTPYLIAGIGASKYKNYYGAFIPLGGGFKVNLFDEASLFITQQYRIPVTTETTNYHFLTSIGISGIIGSKKEPEPKVVTPPPPIDTDGDGIADNADQCPTVAGTLKYNGCPVPDKDKDGVNDDEDQCPEIAGLPKYQGCPIPDTDKDGINDEEDKCPQVAGTARYQGCPVPDTDNDGVNDEEDRCPTVAGIRENNGCPEVKQEVVNKVNYAAKNIFFITGSAKLSNKSYKALDEVAQILKDDADLKLSIEGHTDNVGKQEFNQTLSENRAASVKTYLASKGIEENRLRSAGFGMDQPVADNKTAAGRSKNRRVEMKLGYE
jgi:outer membrane protein OmpA-like peptidoglycan-associated protein